MWKERMMMSVMAVGLLAACGDLTPKAEGWDVNNQKSSQCQQNPEACVEIDEDLSLEADFVSGHLGSYLDCPEEAFDGSSEGTSGEAPAGVASDAACFDDTDCGGALNAIIDFVGRHLMQRFSRARKIVAACDIIASRSGISENDNDEREPEDDMREDERADESSSEL